MALIYITGISGSGKSSVREELIRRGYEAHGTDEDGIAAFYHNETGQRIDHHIPAIKRTPEWRSNHSWNISLQAVQDLVKKAKGKTIFLCGTASNDDEVWDLFEKVVALTVNEEILKHRIQTRANNDFGKVQHELEDILSWQKTAKLDYERLGAIIVDATQPIEQVVDAIVKLIKPDTDQVDKLAKIVWDYLKMDQPAGKADAIIGFGNHDLRVAKLASELFLAGYAPILVFAGGRGKHTPTEWNSEAEEFAKAAINTGVSKEKILIENKSSNTGENIQFTRELLQKKGIFPEKIILVHKPYMTRRAYASLKKQWPELEVIVTSPQIKYEDYPNEMVTREEAINTMVGDLLRIKDYAAKGFSIPQKIPSEVWGANQKLIALGFNKYVL